MRILFSDSVTPDQPFCTYVYDEVPSLQKNYVNIRSIVQDKTSFWVEELAKSHINICNKAALNMPAIWMSGWTRLDLRPWAQESVIKPFFFALAILEWIKRQNGRSELIIVGGPITVAHYLQELAPEIEVDISNIQLPQQKQRQDLFITVFSRAAFKIFRYALNVARFHLIHSCISTSGVKNIIAYEHLQNTSLQDGHRYYYTSLLENIDSKLISFFVTGLVPPIARGKPGKDTAPKIVANDLCTAWELAYAVTIEFSILVKLALLILVKPPCTVNGYTSKILWQNFLIPMMEHQGVMSAYLAHRGLRRLVAKHDIQNIVYPYEEKGIERSLLLAIKNSKIQAIGFTSHPQHALGISMQDRRDSNCPKPDSYAFCGSMYKEYYRGWGNKKNSLMTIWGSEKGLATVLPRNDKAPSMRPNILLVLSHPNELDVFGTWLTAEPKICELVDFSIRRYMAVNAQSFETQLKNIQQNFKNVQNVEGTLRDNVAESDMVAYCGTSAGIEAISMGRVSIHLGINDFFAMNPLFDEFGHFLACFNSADFLNLLVELLSMSSSETEELLNEQRQAAAKIFSPIDTKSVLTTLSGTNP
jgi:hypothetical protein